MDHLGFGFWGGDRGVGWGVGEGGVRWRGDGVDVVPGVEMLSRRVSADRILTAVFASCIGPWAYRNVGSGLSARRRWVLSIMSLVSHILYPHSPAQRCRPHFFPASLSTFFSSAS